MVRFIGKNLFGMAKSRKKHRGIVIFGNDFDIKAGDNCPNGWLMSIILVSNFRCVVDA